MIISAEVHCHGQSSAVLYSTVEVQTTHLFSWRGRERADFLLLGRWRRITLFTMCKRLTEFSNLLPYRRTCAIKPHYYCTTHCTTNAITGRGRGGGIISPPPFATLMNYGFLLLLHTFLRLSTYSVCIYKVMQWPSNRWFSWQGFRERELEKLRTFILNSAGKGRKEREYKFCTSQQKSYWSK